MQPSIHHDGADPLRRGSPAPQVSLILASNPRHVTTPASYDDPAFHAAERAVGRRRIVATVIALVAFSGLAGGAAVAAVATAQNERTEHTLIHVDATS